MKTSLEILQSENLELKQKLTFAQEQLEWLKRQLFGKKSEKIVKSLDEEQLSFEGFEIEEKLEPESKVVSAHTRAKPNRQGQDALVIPDDLPKEVIVLDLPEEEKICKETGAALVKIGEEISHKLAIEPGKFFIKKYIRFKYVHPQKEEMGVKTCFMPDSIIPKCRADESLLADILVKKFSDHLPLNRITEIYGRDRVQISRKLLS